MPENRAAKLSELPQTNAISNADLFYVVSNGQPWPGIIDSINS
jgi:hypothetical protein